MASAPLRIAYLISHFHPRESGAERQALAQGREMVRRGHAVRVVTRAIPGLPRDDDVDGVRIHRWIRTANAGPLFALSFVAGAIRSLRRLRDRIDLIHTHQALWESIATGLGREAIGRPVLVQPASSGYFGEAEEMARTKGFPTLRRLALRNRHFAAISADIERQWIDLGVPPDRMVRLASGVDAEHFRPGPSRVAEDLPMGPQVVFTGRLHPQKNVGLLLDAWSQVAARTSAWLVLVGDGPEREALESRARDLGIANRVRFVGAVPDPADYLRAAEVFVLPSVAEGMSNSLLEAMACGLPCLASHIGGNTDLIEPGRTGWLVPPGDREAWSSALLQALHDLGRSREMGRAARQRIEEEYAMPVIADRYEALYRAILRSPRA